MVIPEQKRESGIRKGDSNTPKKVAAQIQIKQFKECLGTYNKLKETCFLDCVKEFTTREVKLQEQNETLAAKAGLLGQPC
ncbi:mitochondrial import inner membrane translocase subunit Tim9-like [Tenrec ecaudatus]|uniref:mitochondrial import inner membrane translocase subunit Tim9-like n=1 Tax=Tenrec ecaudatus TaxID=94439 RepID=UPI003F5A62A7